MFAVNTQGLISSDGRVRRFNIAFAGVNQTSLFPKAHTCFNRLDLPIYNSKEVLAEYIMLVRCRMFFILYVVVLSLINSPGSILLRSCKWISRASRSSNQPASQLIKPRSVRAWHGAQCIYYHYFKVSEREREERSYTGMQDHSESSRAPIKQSQSHKANPPHTSEHDPDRLPPCVPLASRQDPSACGIPRFLVCVCV